MPIFHCKVINREGRSDEFLRDALSEELLIRELNGQSLFPVEIRELGGSEAQPRRPRKASRGAVLEFTGTLSLLLSSGLSFKDALEIAQTVYRRGEVNRIIVHLLEEIRKGRSVGEAVESFSRGLPPLFKGLVRIGEKVGTLEIAFARLFEHLSEERRIRDKLTGSLIYPVLVLCVALVGIAVIGVFVLPKITEMFAQLGSELPARIVAAMELMHGLLRAAGVLLALIAAAVAFVFIVRRRSEAWAEKIDRAVLKVPFLGRVRYLQECLALLFSMETLTASGFTVEDSLKEAGSVLTNRALRSGVLRARERIEKGENLSAAFLEDGLFDERLGHWIAVGERSGQIEKVFGQLRRYYQGEIEKWSGRFMTVIEPALIILVGLILFVVVIFFVTPIFSLYEGFV
jgi:type IV pilus assembly protein PilC